MRCLKCHRAFQSLKARGPRLLTRFLHSQTEILWAIASYLSTNDFLNTRLALRSLVPIFHQQEFWQARFTIGGERSWLFEASQACNADWKYLIHRTNQNKLGFNLQNRRRIWRLFNTLSNCVSLSRVESKTAEQPSQISFHHAAAQPMQAVRGQARRAFLTRVPYILS